MVTSGLDGEVRVGATVERTTGPPAAANVSTPGLLGPGESGTVRADVTCARPGDGGVTLRLHVSGEGFGASVTRHVEVACPAAV